ncbi:hypothetical protein AS181_03770 [Gordonia sp. SGD-V-85]|nr:hypothetical protein AS181_03770 [Gordonia sp. SGD-V-85]
MQVVEWLSLVVSLIAAAISVVAYRSTLPRLKVTAKGPVILVGQPTLRGAVQVRVDNNGGGSALVRSVVLRSVDSHQVAGPDNDLPNPARPYTLEPRGGTALWNFDTQRLAHEAAGDVRDTPLVVRAEVEIGTKKYRSGRVTLNLPGETRSHLDRRTRFKWWVESWISPRVSVQGAAYSEPPALDAEFVEYRVETSGRGVTRRHKLTLVVEHAGNRRERVKGVDQIDLPRLRPRKRKSSVTLPVVDDSAREPGDEYWWIITRRDGVGTGHGIGAVTRSELPRIRREIEDFLAGQTTDSS